MGAAAGPDHAELDRLQRAFAGGRRRYRCEDVRGPEGQAHRLRRRLARAEPECARGAGVRRSRRPRTSRSSNSPAITRCGRAPSTTTSTLYSARPSQAPPRSCRPRRAASSGPPLPPTDKAGWDRVRKIGPYFTEHNATCGAGEFSKDKPIQMGAYPYPIYTVYAKPARSRCLHADQGADRGL